VQPLACVFDDLDVPPRAAEDIVPSVGLREALVEAPEYPRVRIARDEVVMRRIGEIRYRQYVERQGKNYRAVGGLENCLVEEIDAHSVNIYAEDSRNITCALRIGELVDERNSQAGFLRALARHYGIPERLTLTCSRLVRSPAHSGRHVVQLIDFVRLQTVRAGWRYCIMQTAERLVPFFRKFEFHETGIWSDDPVAGRLQALVLDTRHQPVQRKA
jgi:hypothetical protein